MAAKTEIPGVSEYSHPAGGWDALQAVARALRAQSVTEGTSALLRNNQPDGFDCPGCAWPDPKHTSSFEFCENGAKAVSWEATKKRTTPEFFAAHPVAELWNWTDHDLENQGRLTHPVVYDRATDRFLPLSWDDAFARIGATLAALPDPDMVEFYTSGRASNEAAFLFQLFGRAYGTNNFPDCSNMCHEATSVGLPDSIGVGKGTVTLEDFEHCDAVFSFGHNPGTNHPRMMGTLRDISRRGAPIVVFNPLKERALERFANPKSTLEMATFSSTPIASEYVQLRVGGDAAALQGIMKHVLARDAASRAEGGPGVLDRDFIAEHTQGFDGLRAQIEATPWEAIEDLSGLPRADLAQAADIYIKAERVILCYGMGITQHMHGTETVQQIANLLMLRGNIGREGAGICPLRGHSNVQGDRTVGITEKPSKTLLDGMEKRFGFRPPERHGHDAMQAIEAIAAGSTRALICLGGNLAVALPDHDAVFPAMRKLALAVHVATKLNRSHLLLAEQSFILPCLGRTERDVRETGPQSVTVEDSMSMVHASQGRLPPASDQLLSEPAIVARLARATLGAKHGIEWDAFAADYDKIRDAIEAVFADFADFNTRIREPGGFRLDVAASRRAWHTKSGKAQFIPAKTLEEDPPARGDILTLTTLRSHDQYNTTIYGLNDRYRGITGRRDVVFMNAGDLAMRGLAHGDTVTLESAGGRTLSGYTALAYDIPPGCVAAYYPEANVLMRLADHDRSSGTPAYKSVPVRVRAATAKAA
jgi:molybdopterin-dependent oxidoreductase alpha subunit